MARSSKSRGVRWLRAVLLVALLAVIAGVAALFQLGRASRPSTARPAATSSAAESPSPTLGANDATVLSEGFDYEQQVAGRPVFRLQGERFTTDREGKVALQGVRLVLYRDGEPYEVRSRTAIYDPDTRAAELDGDVEVSGGGGWQLSGARLDLVEGGNAIVSREGRIHFRRGPNLAGSARRMRYELELQALELSGQVVVSGREEGGERLAGLAAERMTWQRDGATVVGEGEVRLTADLDRLAADRIDARLTADGGAFETATATGAVAGSMHDGPDSAVDFTAGTVTVQFESASGGPRSVLMGGDTAAAAEVLFRQARGVRRRVTAPTVLLELAGGRPERASASAGVVLREELPGGGTRSAAGERLVALFDAAGELASAQISGGARLREGDWTAEGDLAEVLDGGGAAQLSGRPARAHGERGELRAPNLRFTRAGGRLDGSGGVRATMRQAATPLAAGDAESAALPIDVEASEATFYDSPRRFEFRDDVKAAQGDTLLFADRLDGEEAAGRVTALGAVRTQWTDRAAVAEGRPPVVTVITAGRLDYDRQEGAARYREAIQVRQERRSIGGDELLVELDEKGAARRMLVTGNVSIEDDVSGRTVTGASADYDLASGEVVVLGEPVVLREQSGTTLRGRRALFDQRTGAARMLSDAP